jgi:hypothetical protein
MKTYQALFVGLAISIWSIAMSDERRTKTVDTPDGSITTNTTTVEPVPQKIEVANPKDTQAFDAYASQGNRFVSTYLPRVTNPSLKDFDEAFRLWQVEKKRRYTAQQVIEILGAYLGNKLIVDFQMEWVVVKDEYGTDFAVRAKKYEVLSFPFSSVAKRIENNQYDFMAGVYHTVRTSIESGEYKAR